MRASVSVRPRMWQISTAPPGVTASPETAMRTGHMTRAFLQPNSAAAPIKQSCTASSVQSVMAARRGRIFLSMSSATVSSHLDFLWT